MSIRKAVKRVSPFADIASGLVEAIDIAKGKADPKTYRAHVPEKINVRAIRKSMNLTQEQFAAIFGFNTARVRDWEQARSSPDGAVRAYLKVIAHNPKQVMAVLNGKS